jgi:hypothetical protein
LDRAEHDLAAREPGAVAARAGASFDRAGRIISLDYLNTCYAVQHPSGRVFAPAAPEVPVSEVTRLILLHYLITSSGAAPRARWISYRELPGGNAYFAAFRRRVVDRLVRRFGPDPARLTEAAERLGARRLPLGDASALVQALPLLPVAFVLWGGDAMTGPAGNVLFDETAPAHLATEDLAGVAGDALSALLRVLPKS